MGSTHSLRSRARALLVAVVAVCAAAGASSVRATADDSAGIRVIGQAPNLFAPSVSTAILSDPVNHLVFEADPATVSAPCAVPYGRWIPWAVLDADTFAVKKRGCGGQRSQMGVQDVPMVAIDSRDRVLFFSSDTTATDGQQLLGNAPPGSPDAIVAVSEDSLKILGSWSLPLTVAPIISSLSWYPPTDRLTVLTAWSSGPDGGHMPTMSLLSYSAASLLARGSTGTPEWTVGAVPGCSTADQPVFSQPDAVRSLDLPDIFIPCQLNSQKNGVVKLHLTTSGCGTADACPDNPVQSQVAVVPGTSGDFLFDPGSDRGFVPSQTNSGTALLVYDGRTPNGDFVGRAGVAQTQGQQENPDFNCAMFNLDATTGRIYATGPPALVAIDGRRTPLAPGSLFASLGGEVQYTAFPVLPPDAANPHPRLLVNYEQGGTPNAISPCRSGSAVSHFSVLEDDRPPTTDPPASSVDLNTVSGAIPPGSQSSTSYTGTARGFGVHAVWTGSYGGVVNNQLQGTLVNGNNVPLGSGTRDLLAGWVERAHLQDGTGLAAAIGAGDGNDTTSSGLQQCTDTQSLGSCAGQPLPAAGSTPTGQLWPVMEAACSSPDTASHDTGGVYTTSWNQQGSGQSTPAFTEVPGSGPVATAHAACASAQPVAASVTAAAALADLSSGTSGAPTLTVASTTSSSSVSPGGAGTGVVSTTTSTARGIRLDLGGGSFLEIGSIIQVARATARGTAGTATATRSVTISDVTVGEGGTTTTFCAAACTGDPQGVVDAINAQLPGVAALTLPQPYEPFGGTSTSIAGSPGGYQAIIEPQPAEQYGDELFNSMTTASGETSILPALRLVVYSDGAYQLDRQVFDFAGVEADAEQGVTVIPPAPPLPAQSSFTTQVLESAAGVIPPSLGSRPVAQHSGGGDGLAASILQTVQRIFKGLSWLFRSPLEALRTLAFFLLLGMPLVLMARRRLQLRDMDTT